ncbi:MAG: hypothetical protein FVQ85_03590 [Planctomycetes bacterium]|nr:hypothetical protein [Planctomycetota bacterium]
MILLRKPAAATDMVLYVVALSPVAWMCLVLQVFVPTIVTTVCVAARDNGAAIVCAVIIRVVVLRVVVEPLIIAVEIRPGMSYAVMRMKYAVGLTMEWVVLYIIVIHHARMKSPTLQFAAKTMKIFTSVLAASK